MSRSSRREHYINPTSIAVSAACVVAVLVLAGIGWYRVALGPVSSDGTLHLVVVKPSGVKQLAGLLEAEGLIRSASAFRLMAKSHMALYHQSPKAGAYDLSPSMSAEEVWKHLCGGKVARRRVTFPEGFTVAQMAERVQEQLAIPRAEFLAAARGVRATRNVGFRLPPGQLEGYLFPSTYDLPAAEEPEFVVGELLAGFRRQFYLPNEQRIKGRGLSLHEIVTLASLVEREARVPRERALIAGVLQNRLNKGMRLQCDATVQYALPGHKARLLYRDLKVQSPYNTYLHPGLPPGPICNPGLACLEAALMPAKTDCLFYVARRDGTHIFTRTFAEHQQAIKQARGH